MSGHDMSDGPADPAQDPARGVVLAASGAVFVAMARKLARSVRTHCPGLAVDLFTDTPIDDPLFDRVHAGPEFAGKSKITAMRASRFERSLFLDADILLVADMRDAFEMLDAFDMAFAHDQWRNSTPATRIWRRALPAGFPQPNAGVIVWIRNEVTTRFLAEWDAAYRMHGAGVDQPALRELLWEARALRFAILPEEYNLWDLKRIDRMGFRHTAPRLLHSNLMKRPRVLESDGSEVSLILGHARAARLRLLLDNDRSLNPQAPPERNFARSDRLGVALAGLRDIPRKVRALAGRPYP